ncbi:MAG: aminotransferase class I/II-fold pyridoxal phosphate-dependent enzyme [Acidobacteria bacterium]|nr:aminotransferase class I/II-fold pyridoxal phosphate-dependent enzyme [Acidobacteriota bacterium]
MIFEPFELERWQSHWEHSVHFNLSESGVHSMPVDALVESSDILDQVLNQPLAYAPTNGSEALRAQIAGLYTGAQPENVLVTTGCAEANFLTVTTLTDKRDHAVVMMPNYMQVWGLLSRLGARPKPWRLQQKLRWAPNPEDLSKLITDRTRLIAVCNPNNPTGAILDKEIMVEICRAAARVGAWILADEIYHGTERNGKAAPSFWGLYDKVIVTNGLSKAYGLPGLRIGWMVAPKDHIETCWGQKDYTSISPSILSDRLARLALAERKRAQILERTSAILNNNYALLKAWLAGHTELLQCVLPLAGASAWIRYNTAIPSADLARRLLQEKSLLVVPGAHFLMEGFLRVGFGCPQPQLKTALEILWQFFLDLNGGHQDAVAHPVP